MILKLDPSLCEPLSEQVAARIRELIDNGTLPAGTVLPSSRKLSEKLGISRSTVYHAYSELQAMGYLSSRPGSFNRVQKRRQERESDGKRPGVISWEKKANPEVNAVYNESLKYMPDRTDGETPGNKIINMSGLEPDKRLFPMTEFKRSMNYALQNTGPSTLLYGSFKGYLPLREYLARRLRLHGISASSDEILITNGAQQALDLLIRMLASPEKTILIESPTYGVLLPLLKVHKAKFKCIPMNSRGMDLDYLSRVLKNTDAAFIYTMPNFHNPTGITTSHHHRERLFELCTTHKVPLVEDGFEEDLKYFGKVDLPVKSMDEGNSVIYVGTFSKALFPGLRIGWINAPRECLERLTALKRFTDLSSGNLSQAAIHFFCEQGYYDLHLKKLYRTYRRRMECALRKMESTFPRSVSWTKPAGGYLIWVKMKRRLSKEEFSNCFETFGVRVSPGTLYFPDTVSSEYFRISISSLNEEEITEGIERLARALNNF